MTIRLHSTDPDRAEFAARVVGVDGRAIVLDRSYFFGPHPLLRSDTGWIGRCRIIGLTRTGGGAVGHLVADQDGPLPVVGDAVDCRVDLARRFRLRQLHTAQHVFEHAADATNDLTGARCGPVSGRTAHVELDFAGPRVDIGAAGHWFETAVRNDYSCGVTSSPLPPFGQLWHLDGYGFRHCDAIHLASTGGIGGVRYLATSTGPSRARVELWAETTHRLAESHGCRGPGSRIYVAAHHRPRYTGRPA